MRRTIIKIICFAVLAATVLSLAACLGRSDEEREKAIRYDENGIGYIRYDANRKISGYNDFCVVRIPVDISDDHYEIEIPEQYTCMSLSPNFSCDWKIVGEGFISHDLTESSDNTPIFTVYIHISKQMGSISLPINSILYKKIESGEYKMYIIKPYFYCDEENKWYYSEDGVLYHKSDKYKSDKRPLAYQ